jgi:hypothetical protein
MIKILKDPDILKKKPKLILKPNHYILHSEYHRQWHSTHQGQAIKDGYGWYKRG